MPINSDNKGKTGERELCKMLATLFGLSAHRTEQHCGKAGDSDVTIKQLPELLVESKREEKLSIHKAMKKAVSDSNGKLPAVFHRRNKTEWLVTIRLSDMFRFASMIASAMSMLGNRDSTCCQQKDCDERQQQWEKGQQSTGSESGWDHSASQPKNTSITPSST